MQHQKGEGKSSPLFQLTTLLPQNCLKTLDFKDTSMLFSTINVTVKITRVNNNGTGYD
jgi:hypothetical protein